MPHDHNHIALHVVHVGFLDIGKDWNSQDVKSSFWRFYINNRDTAAITWRGGRYPLPAGQAHLIPAYVQFSCHNRAKLRHLYVHFEIVGLPAFTQEQLFTRPFSCPLSDASKRLLEHCRTNDVSSDSFYRDCLVQAALLDAISRQLLGLPGAQRRQLKVDSCRSSAVAPAMAILESALPGALRVADLAEACAMSEDHFSRVFRSSTGQTPARYILQRRIALAARELLYGDGVIDRVSRRHGFANRFHFTRAFSRVMGTTPAAYRRTNRV